MSDTKIKPADIWAEVQKIAAKNPDYVYPKRPEEFPACAYQRNGEPSCIVGKALFKLGVDVDTLEGFDSGGESGINEILCELDGELFDLSDTTGLTEVVLVQSKQDQEVPWGEAVREAADDAPGMRYNYE